MQNTRRPWSENDIAKLKGLAGKLPAKKIASQLGRTEGATLVEASKLKISLLRVRSLADHVGLASVRHHLGQTPHN
jgi:hypothetical protein